MRLGDVPTTTLDQLLERYEVLFMDAYGVFMHTSGAIPGAPAALARIKASGRPFQVLTNDASRLIETSALRYASMGFELEPTSIITSGSLLAGHFQRHGLVGARCVVMGPADSVTYVRGAGGQVVAPDEPADLLVLCDEDGYPLLPVVDSVLSNLLDHVDRGRPMAMLLPNPDLIYPKGEGAFGITAGALGHLFEGALQRRYPDRDDLRFTRLGKPHAAIIDQANYRTLFTRDGFAVTFDRRKSGVVCAERRYVESNVGQGSPQVRMVL